MRDSRSGTGQFKHSLLKRLGAATAAVCLAVACQNAAGLQATSQAQQVSDDAPYRNASLSVDARVEDLLSRMTLEEKIAQITTIWTTKTELFDEDGILPGRMTVRARRARWSSPSGMRRRRSNWSMRSRSMPSRRRVSASPSCSTKKACTAMPRAGRPPSRKRSALPRPGTLS